MRLPRLFSRIGKVCFLFGALGALSLILPLPMFAIGSLIGLLAWPLFILSYILSLTQTSFTGAVEASASELVVTSGRRRTTIPIAKIAGAMVVEREVAGAMMPTVEIELTNGDRLTVRMADLAGPYLLVQTLGFGPGGKRVHATFTKPTRRLLHPLVGLGCYLASLGMMMVLSDFGGSSGFESAFAAYPILTLLLYQVVARVGRAPRITVGEDGVVVRSVRGRRFIARRDIAFASATQDGGLAIEERSGKRTAVVALMLDRSRVAAVRRLIQDRMGPMVASAERFAHYERAGRALAAWRDHLAHAMHDTSYRQNAATVDEAAAVLRSAEATPEQRVGAALALRVAGQPPERIRIAAVGAADDRMREALEAVADADDDRVIEKKLKRLRP